MANITKGSTDVTRYFVLEDAATGEPAESLTITSLTISYVRNRAAIVTATASALAAANSSHADNNAKEIDPVNAKGLHRVDFPDAAFATGVDKVILGITGAAIKPYYEEVQLVNFNPEDGVRLGLTALPNAAAEAAGGLYTRGTGAGQIAQTNNGSLDVRIAAIDADTVFNIKGLAINNPDGDAITVDAGSGGSALSLFGSGSGSGLVIEAGSTGSAVIIQAGGTSGNGVEIIATEGAPVTGINPTGTADGTGSTTTLLDSTRLESDGHWNGQSLRITSGPLTGQTAQISSYILFDPVLEVPKFTLTPALTGATDTGMTYEILPRVSVGLLGTDVVNSNSLAGTAVSEIQSGLATSTVLSTVSTNVSTILGRVTASVATASALATSDGKLDTLLTRVSANVALASALSTVESKVDTIDGIVDTIVARVPDTISLANIEQQVVDALLSQSIPTTSDLNAAFDVVTAAIAVVDGEVGTILSRVTGNVALASALATSDGKLDTLLTRVTAAVATNTDMATLLSRVTAAVATAANLATLDGKADILLSRVTAAVATASALATSDGKLDTLVSRVTAAVATASALSSLQSSVDALPDLIEASWQFDSTETANAKTFFSANPDDKTIDDLTTPKNMTITVNPS